MQVKFKLSEETILVKEPTEGLYFIKNKEGFIHLTFAELTELSFLVFEKYKGDTEE